VHCGRLGTSVLDHQPPLTLHHHVEGSGCCISVPSCSDCSHEQAGSLAWARRRFGQIATPSAEEEAEPVGFGVDDAVWDVPWLDDLRELPPEATWPRYMTVPHPSAVGSLGWEAIDWLRSEARLELRWWQRLVLVRQLEHDDTEMLVWLDDLLTTSRQSGKSTVLRGGAMWRIHQADRFGEEQTLMHTGKDLPVCKEVQRLARAWARARGYAVREQNGNEEITEPESGSRWMVRGKHSVYGYPISSGLVDEAWGVAPEVVEDGLEPTMLERFSPQLLLASTAHRRTTPLFPGRRSAALASLADPVSTLLIEWSARRDAELDDREAWRMASPHWSARRERLIESRLAKALSGQSLDPDEPDPIESFRAQYLNIWPAVLVATGPGEVLLEDAAWSAAFEDLEVAGPLVLAVADWQGRGAAAAAVGVATDGRLVVGGWTFDRRHQAFAWIGRWADARPGSRVLIGPTLAGSIEADELQCPVTPAGPTQTRAGLSLLRELIAGGRLVHDGSSDLATQVSAARVRSGATGLSLVSGPRLDLLSCAAWAVAASEQAELVPAVN